MPFSIYYLMKNANIIASMLWYVTMREQPNLP